MQINLFLVKNMAKQDYYEILGVSRNASKEEIKMAYKRLARKYHPDVAQNKEEAEIKFRQINEAYSVLSDEEKRRAYDQFGHSGVSSSVGSPFDGGFSDFGFGDFFDMMFDMGFGGGFTTHRRRSARPQAMRGRDIRHDVEITLEQAYKGVEVTVEIESYQNCPICNGRRVKPGSGYRTCNICHGTGMVQNVQSTMFGRIVTSTVCSRCNGEGRIPKEVCEECHGEGRVIRKRKITVNIPPGVDTGNRIRIPEEGEAGYNGGPAGDLYVFVFVKEHEIFKRKGKDLYMELPIGFVDAALGTVKEIETFDGKEKVEIKEGTQSETIITLKGKGMPDLHGGRRGDLHIKVKVVTPTKLTKRQRELLCEFAKEGPQFHHCPTKKSIFDKIMDAFKGN